ncbi:uncharacterized protein LOC130716126 isoform X2 [Lotus japonicus]|uniref:uncharacterized protein LOC130716126 isoform X2 n=1 Tax=Lotus japonicus TaxID=34305 RepID=UPI0025834870|nr:uncharacterized protein LOC130716126 isoform X2 [Lotus japonicus]
MAPSYCVNERKPCVGWVETYFNDCLCTMKDDISFSLGLTSLAFWGIAEIPQIITIFRTKSNHGMSLAFLCTWVAGDICNLVGCLLEPATLPTQYYTALLYMSTTILLVSQVIYFDYISRWCTHRHNINNKGTHEEEERPLKPKASEESEIPIPNGTPRAAPRREYYYMSARSLAGSATPPSLSYIRAARSGPSAMEFNGADSSSDDEAPPPTSASRSLAGSYGTFLAASLNLPLKSDALRHYGYTGFTTRKLLQGDEIHNAIGLWLGWLMAAIYISSRLPQIWLNIKRGSVEGLSPFMFIFALVANVTYVGSILVRATEFKSIKANMPWLLDATVCVTLDIFIISQYIYYRYFQKREREASDDRDYKEVGKAAAS